MDKKELTKAVIDIIMLIFATVFLVSALSNLRLFSGTVRGTEFSLLIDLILVANKILVVLISYILYRWFFPTRNSSKLFDLLKNVQIRINNKNSNEAAPKENN